VDEQLLLHEPLTCLYIRERTVDQRCAPGDLPQQFECVLAVVYVEFHALQQNEFRLVLERLVLFVIICEQLKNVEVGDILESLDDDHQGNESLAFVDHYSAFDVAIVYLVEGHGLAALVRTHALDLHALVAEPIFFAAERASDLGARLVAPRVDGHPNESAVAIDDELAPVFVLVLAVQNEFAFVHKQVAVLAADHNGDGGHFELQALLLLAGLRHYQVGIE